MKVLFWSERYLPHLGGLEIFGEALMQRLRTMGHSFSVVTSRSDRDLPERDVIDSVPVYRFPFQDLLMTRNLRLIRGLCDQVLDVKKKLQPDLIHMHSLQPSVFYHLHTNGAHHCPTLVTIHAPPMVDDGSHLLYSKLVRSASLVTVVSEATRETLLKSVPDMAARTRTVLNGLEPPDVTPSPLSFDRIHFVCAGRVVPDKGFDVALKAFRLFLEVNEFATMTIAGDGPERANLEALAGDLGIFDSVDFAGWIDHRDIPKLMNTATAVIVPSRWEEPFGLVALQAAQVGRPVVATRVGGLPEVVVDGETGLIVESEKPQAMFDAMMQLAGRPELAGRLGRQARERALKRFTMKRCAGQYDQIYREIAS